MLYGWEIPPASTRPWYLPFNPACSQLTAPASFPNELPPPPSSPIIDVVGLTPAVTPTFQGNSPTAPDAANPGADTTTITFQARPRAQPPAQSAQPISVLASLLAAPAPNQPRRDLCAIFQANPILSPARQFSLLNGSFPVVPGPVADTCCILHGISSDAPVSSPAAPAVEDICMKLKRPHDQPSPTADQKRYGIGRVQDGAIRKLKRMRKKAHVHSCNTFEEEVTDIFLVECECFCTNRSCDYCKLRSKRICIKEPIETAEVAEQSDSTEQVAELTPASVSSDHSTVKELSEKEQSIAMMVYALDQQEETSGSPSAPITVMLYEKPTIRPPTDDELRDAELAIALVIFLDCDCTDAIDITALANMFLTRTILIPLDFDCTIPGIDKRILEAIDKLFRVFRDV